MLEFPVFSHIRLDEQFIDGNKCLLNAYLWLVESEMKESYKTKITAVYWEFKLLFLEDAVGS